MKVVASTGREDIAIVYIAELSEGRVVEFVESLQPPLPREQKWVLIVSTLFGCPVKCPICDAGNFYQGKLTKEEILAQIDFPVRRRFHNGNVPVGKFKVQFARMGEPSFNANVLGALEELPHIYNAPGLMPCVSTVAPAGREKFFEDLIEIKRKLYQGKFQLQFSIHTTDEKLRDRLIPLKKWDFARIARYGEQFYENGDRKITLNFALVKGAPVDPQVLHRHFNPDIFLVKITPLNPTYHAAQNKLTSYIDPYQTETDYQLVEKLRSSGYDVLVSIGETRENQIGSNCGQYVTKHLMNKGHLEHGYQCEVKECP